MNLNDMIENAPAPADDAPARNAGTFGALLAPDLAYHASNHENAAVLGQAPRFVDGVKAALGASERATRREIDGIELSASRIVLDHGRAALETAHGAFALRTHAFGQLARLAGAPPAYLVSLPPSIALDAANWGLRRIDASPRTLRMEGDEIRAVVSERYAALDDRPFYRLIYRALERAGRLREAQIEAWSVGGGSSTLRVSFGEVRTDGAGEAFAGRGGHVIRGGFGGRGGDGEGFGLRATITARNSELGTGAAKVTSGLHRHWCSNGATIERLAGACWNRRHTGDWEAQAAELAAVLHEIIATSERVMARAVPGAARDVFDVDALQARLYRLAKLTRAERAAIAREALAEALGQYDGAITTMKIEAADTAKVAEAAAIFAALQQRKLQDEADSVVSTLKAAPPVSAWNLINGVTAEGRRAAEQGRADRAAELEALGGELLAAYL